MKEIDSIQRDLLIEGLEDYVGLWQVARAIRTLMGDVAMDLVREFAMQRLGPLLLEGCIEAGFPSANSGFESWGLAGNTAIDRIDSEWRELGKDPDIWEICWFKNTDRWNALAKTLHE